MAEQTSPALRDELIGALVGLARATEGNDHLLQNSTAQAVVTGLVASSQDDASRLREALQRVDEEKRKLVPSCYQCAAPCGRTDNFDMRRLENAQGEVRRLKLQLLTGIQGIAAGESFPDAAAMDFLYTALFAIGMEDWEEEDLLPLVQKAEKLSHN